jgi:tetratricopeptide (TPR) repeat protein
MLVDDRMESRITLPSRDAAPPRAAGADRTDPPDARSLAILRGHASLAEVHGYDAAALERIYARGYDAWNAGDQVSATSDFGLLTLLQPLDRRFHFAFACGLQSQGEWRHALTFFNYALSMQADDPFVAFHIGECLQSLEAFDAARDAFEAVRSLCYGAENGGPATAHLRARAEAYLLNLNR